MKMSSQLLQKALCVVVAIIAATSTATAQDVQLYGSVDEVTALRLTSSANPAVVAGQAYSLTVSLRESPPDPRYPYRFNLQLESLSRIVGDAAFDTDGNLLVRESTWLFGWDGWFPLLGGYLLQVDFDGQEVPFEATAPPQSASFGRDAVAINDELGGELLSRRAEYPAHLGSHERFLDWGHFDADFVVFLDNEGTVIFGSGDNNNGKSPTINVAPGEACIAQIVDGEVQAVMPLQTAFSLSTTGMLSGKGKKNR